MMHVMIELLLTPYWHIKLAEQRTIIQQTFFIISKISFTAIQ